MMNTDKSAKQLKGAGRHVKDEEFESELLAWINLKREGKQRVSRRSIQVQALKMTENNEENSFKASRGWLEKFLIRHNLRARRPTTVCQKAPSCYEDVIIKFILYIRRLRKENKYDYIYGCDETSVWLDSSNTKCIAKCGSREVAVLDTGHTKQRITVLLTARSDGLKCLPFVLLNRRRPDSKIVEKWFMNDLLTEEYLMKVFGQGFFVKRLLVWDSFRSHISEHTKKIIKQLKLETAVIPSGCTKYVQPADVMWNSVFKSSIRKNYDDWMLHGEREHTSSGNPRPPSMLTYLSWVADAWDSIPTEDIKRSFKVCGITNEIDGPEDELIHCFKKEGQI
ncbi:HTH CENPB-type domain-containing protein, partial [Meloidogyne graminicola]